ncbi:MAG: glycosyltransferase [Pseudomonadota bacterium]
MPELSVVICTLNEAASIGAVIDEVDSALADVSHEIIVVDDDSEDATQRIVQDKARAGAPVRLLVRRGRTGLASAAIEGWNAAQGRRLAIMDGDGQHDPKVLHELDALVRSDRCNLAVMSRYRDGGASGLGKRRAVMSRLATWFTGLLLRSPLTDPMSGMFVMRRELFEEARPRLTGVGFKILVDLVASLRTPPVVQEVGAPLRSRSGGTSKLDIRVIVDLGGLLMEKATGGFIPARFAPFALVGATGVVFHATVLTLAKKFGHEPMAFAQAAAIICAMTWNYWLNNSLTFRDRRRTGWAFLTGALIFYLACLGGGVISEVVATAATGFGLHWFAAGILGALLGGVWNYVSSSQTTWRAPKASAGSVEELTPGVAVGPVQTVVRGAQGIATAVRLDLAP